MNRRIILFAILLLSPILTFAQSDVNKMLKDINGKVDEIVIKSEGKTFTFSGDEATKLFASMKENKKMKHFEFISKDGKEFRGDSLHKKIMIKKSGDDLGKDKDILVFIDEDFDSDDADMKKIEKKVIVSNEGGEKIVTVTINEDGKENIEVYEGNAADKYLDKMESDEHCKIKIHDKSCHNKKHKKIIIEKEEKE